MGARQPKGPKGPKGPGSGKLGKPPFGIEVEITDGMQDIPLEEITDWGLVATPGGAVDPYDCERWPNSPFCGGGWDTKLSTGLDEISIAINECEIILTFEWKVLGFGMPDFSIGWRNPDCEPEPEPEPIESPPVPPNENSPTDVGFPPCLNKAYLVEIAALDASGFGGGAGFMVVYGPHGLIRRVTRTVQTSEGLQNYYTWYLRCYGAGYFPAGKLEPTRYYGATSGWYWVQPLGEMSVDAMWIKERSNDAFQSAFVWGTIIGSGTQILDQPDILALPRGYIEIPIRHPFDSAWGSQPGAYIGGMETVFCSFYALWGMNGQMSQGIKNRGLAYSGSQSFSNGVRFDSYPNWQEYCDLIPAISDIELFAAPCVREISSSQLPYPKPKLPMSDCCDISAANSRILKRLEAVLQPTEFRHFVGSKPVGPAKSSVPNYFVIPNGGNGKYKIGSYPEMFEAVFKMMDKNSFIPFKVEIKDNNAAQEGDQSLKLGFPTLSSALKELMQLMIDTESDVDAVNNFNVRNAYMLMQIQQMLVKIHALVEGSADYLGYELQQEVENVEMMYNSDPKYKAEAQETIDKNTEESTELIMNGLMKVSHQPVIVQRNVQVKDLAEALLEITNVLQAMKGGFTKQA